MSPPLTQLHPSSMPGTTTPEVQSAFLSAAEAAGIGFALLHRPEPKVLEANAGLARLLGLPPESVVGARFDEFFQNEHRPAIQRALTTLVRDAPLRMEAERVVEAGRIPLRVEITLQLVGVDGQERVVATVRDIAVRHQKEQGLRLARDLAIEIGNATTFDDALRVTLRRACEMTGWSLGQAWVPFGSRLECAHSFALEPGLEEFQKESQRRYFKLGDDLPGRVWSGRQPAWIMDVRDEPYFARGATAQRVGLVGAFAVPVIARESVVAVLEFFVREARPQDDAFLALLSTIAAQLGQALEWKQAEASLRASEAQYRRFVETAQEGIWAFDTDGRTIYVNHRLANMLGTTPQDMIGRSLLDYMEKRLHHEARRAFARRKQGVRESFEAQLLRKDGTPVWVLVSMTPPVDEPIPTGPLCMVVDLTDRRKAEEHLVELAREQAARAEAEASRRRAALLAQASERLAQSVEEAEKLEGVAGLVLPDFADGLVVLLQDEPGRARRVFARFIDPALEADFGPAVSDEAQRLMNEALHEGRLLRHIEDPSAKPGASPGASMIIAPLRARGRVLGVLTFLRSRTTTPFASLEESFATDLARRTALELDNARLFQQIRQREEQLRQANARLQELDQIRTDFVNKAAHELGTPITPLKMQIELLQAGGHGELTPKQAESLGVMQRNLERLNVLIRDLLDVVRLAKAGWQMESTDLDLAVEIANVLDDYRSQAESAGITVVVEAPDRLPVRADARRLHQLLANLVTNALKFTPPGGRVAVRARRDDDHVIVCVEDSGAGIRSEDLPRLFQPFGQAGEERRRGRGTGLGLYICRGIVEQHGGRIWAESDGPDQGARFWFTLPVGGSSRPPTVAE